jgi:hypothetical protein
VYPNELRIAAGQALIRVDPSVGMEKVAASGIDRKELTLEPTDPEANASVIRQRRYARLKLSRNLIAVTTNLRENFRLSIPEMNLGGGIGSGERHLAPGSLLSLKFSLGVRHIKAQAIVRGARPQAMAFEFVEMDLDERYRLRKLLLELGGDVDVVALAGRVGIVFLVAAFEEVEDAQLGEDVALGGGELGGLHDGAGGGGRSGSRRRAQPRGGPTHSPPAINQRPPG